MPYRQLALQALEGYDLASEHLRASSPGSPEEREAVADLTRWLEEYERLIGAAQATGQPAPPPFPREHS